jgi:diguanylate cyclase (GGDEF)-like protein
VVEDDSDSGEGWAGIETATLSEEQAAENRARGAREDAHLIVLAGNRVGEMIKITKDMSIGRSDAADFQVMDDGVSRTHILLSLRPDGTVVLRDAGSLNGTLVNNEKVGETVLEDGDKIRIGSTAILKFSYSDRLDEQFQKEMLRAAVQDPLTGLYNRRRLMEQLELEVRYSLRHGVALTAIMLDIDHFKRVNDTHGHAVGDAVLRRLGGVLQSITRAEDMAARYGGEEFLLVCRGLDSLVGAKVAERLRRYVEQAQLVPEHPDLRVTVSAGVAALPNPRVQSSEQLIAAVDQALYAAKQSGRNQVVVFS